MALALALATIRIASQRHSSFFCKLRFCRSYSSFFYSHQFFKREIPFHSVGKACHCCNQLTIIVPHLDIAIW